MRRPSRLPAATLLLVSLAAWALLAEAYFDYLPDRHGLEQFHRWFGVDLSDRPVFVRSSGLIDSQHVFRLEATPAELDRIVEAAGLSPPAPQRECLDPRSSRAYWWHPRPAERLRCLERYDPPRVWLDVAYDPMTGVLHARALTF